MRASWSIALCALLVLALAIRLVYIRVAGDLMNGDEAVGALMTLAIARGREFPLHFWGAHYSGTLPFYLGAIAFRLVEPSIAALRLAILPLALVGIAAVATTARTQWGTGAALVGGLWLAAGPGLLFAYSTDAMNGYPEVLAFGGLTLWLGARLARSPRGEADGAWSWALFGAVAGFGVYSLLFVLPVFLGALWALGHHRGVSRRELTAVAVGFVVGLSPLLVYNVVHPGASGIRLAARLFDVSRPEMTHASSLLGLAAEKAGSYLRRLALFPTTLPGNVATFLGLPGWSVLGAAALAAAALVAARTWSRADFGVGLAGRCGLLLLIFVWMSGLDAARHLFGFFLLLPLALAALWACASGWVKVGGAAALTLVLASNVWTTLHEARVGRPNLRGLVEALERRDLRFVYTDYAIAYPLMALSRERIVASPAAGPTNVERHPPYTQAVAASARPAYVFVRDSEASLVFVRELRRAGRTFSREVVDAFDLYLPDRRVDPGELALVRRF